MSESTTILEAYRQIRKRLETYRDGAAAHLVVVVYPTLITDPKPISALEIALKLSAFRYVRADPHGSVHGLSSFEEGNIFLHTPEVDGVSFAFLGARYLVALDGYVAEKRRTSPHSNISLLYNDTTSSQLLERVGIRLSREGFTYSPVKVNGVDPTKKDDYRIDLSSMRIIFPKDLSEQTEQPQHPQL